MKQGSILSSTFFLVIISFIQFACSSQTPTSLPAPELDAAQFPIGYSASPDMLETEHIQMRASLRALPDSNRVRLAINLRNTADESVMFEISRIELRTKSGLRNPPIGGFQDIMLKPDSVYAIVLDYEPITNLKLYKQTGYPGDPAVNYEVHFGNTFLSFDMNKEDSISLKKYLKEPEMHVYELAQNSHKGEQTENEILINGVVFNFKYYAVGDSLIGKLSITNHGHHELLIEPANMFLNFNNRMFLPKSIQINGGAIYKDTLFLPRSARYNQRTAYRLSQMPDTFSLLANGISSHDTASNMLISLQFVRITQ